MIEYHLLKHCLDRRTFEMWLHDVKPSSFSPPARQVWIVLSHWHSVADVLAMPDSGLLVAHATAVLKWTPDDIQLLETGLAQVFDIRVDLPKDTVIRIWLEREIAATMAEESDKFLDKPEAYEGSLLNTMEKQAERLRRVGGAGQSEEDLAVDMEADFESVLSELHSVGDLKWRLRCLRASIGPTYPGLFVVVGGRPEAGKTTLLASEISYMLRQLPENGIVAFFNNESNNASVKFRIYQALLGSPSTKIKADPKAATRAINKALGSRKLMVMDVHNKSISDVEKRLAKLGDDVKLIVFDQASKLDGLARKTDNEAGRLQKLSARLKGLASSCAPVITTIWADGSAEGDMWVDQNQLYGSKTGIPGEAEVIVNIGHSKEPGDVGLRFLNIPKNKSMTCQDERRRHAHWTVLLKHEIARVEDPKQ